MLVDTQIVKVGDSVLHHQRFAAQADRADTGDLAVLFGSRTDCLVLWEHLCIPFRQDRVFQRGKQVRTSLQADECLCVSPLGCYSSERVSSALF